MSEPKFIPIFNNGHVIWFIDQVAAIDKEAIKPSLTSFSNKFQLFRLKDLPIESKKQTKDPIFQALKKTVLQNNSSLETPLIEIPSNNVSNNRKVTFAAKMIFPKGTFPLISYRIMDLIDRKEWDPNLDEGYIVQEFFNESPKRKNISSNSNDTNNEETKKSRIEFYRNNFKIHDLIYMKLKSPTKLVKDRDTLLYRYSIQEDGLLISIMKTYDDTENPLQVSNLPNPSTKTVRAQTRFHGYLIQDKNDHVEIIMLSDHYIGNVPQFLISMLFDKKSIEWYKQFSSSIGAPISKL